MSSGLVPRYYQIKQALKGWIINREFDIGDRIPSENELASRFGVNRLTVRQAISQLVQEGFLVTKRGEGTYVKDNPQLIHSFNLEFSGFIDDLFYQISRSQTKRVELAKITAPKWARERLELGAEEQEIVRIMRVRYKEDRPFAYTVNYLPVHIGDRIPQADLYRKPMLRIMEQDLGIYFTEAFQTIEASFASQEVSEKLGIPAGSPVLFVERTMYTERRRPVELVQSSYPGDIYKYIVRLKRIKGKKGNMWVHSDARSD